MVVFAQLHAMDTHSFEKGTELGDLSNELQFHIIKELILDNDNKQAERSLAALACSCKKYRDLCTIQTSWPREIKDLVLERFPLNNRTLFKLLPVAKDVGNDEKLKKYDEYIKKFRKTINPRLRNECFDCCGGCFFRCTSVENDYIKRIENKYGVSLEDLSQQEYDDLLNSPSFEYYYKKRNSCKVRALALLCCPCLSCKECYKCCDECEDGSSG